MSEIKVDTVAEKTSANGVTIDGLNIKDSKLVTANSVVTSNITDGAISAAKLASGVGGKLLQVVNASTQTQVNNTSGTYADTGLTANITPSATSSKVLVIINQVFAKSNADNFVDCKVFRDSTEMGSVVGRSIAYTGDSGYLYPGVSFSYTVLDSPSSTSQVTYKVQFKRAGSGGGTVRANVDSGASTISLLEVAG